MEEEEGQGSPEGTFHRAPHLWQGQRLPQYSLCPFPSLWLALFMVRSPDLVESSSLTFWNPCSDQARLGSVL